MRPRRLSPNTNYDLLKSFSYSLSVFPPTDHHTATPYTDPTTNREHILIIGCLGYTNSHSREYTEVYRLDLQDYRIEKMQMSGEGPKGGTSGHTSEMVEVEEEEVVMVVRIVDGDGDGEVWRLRVRDMRWL